MVQIPWEHGLSAEPFVLFNTTPSHFSFSGHGQIVLHCVMLKVGSQNSITVHEDQRLNGECFYFICIFVGSI